MGGFDIEQARFNMVEQQIRPWNVLDQGVLDLLFTVRREEFVPAAYRTLAFADLEIPLGGDASMWAPKIEARVLQELALEPFESVLEIGTRVLQALALTGRESALEIGTGSGYFTALLASVAGSVTSVEIDERLAAEAKANLARSDFGRIALAVGDGARGWGRDAYDAIVLTGSTPLLPESLFDQLKPGGRVFAVVGDAPAMTARMVRWTAVGVRTTVDLFETVIAPLRNAAAPTRFEF
jgi:protein-L-isoaspartate(D-aspartate) O-methyltransferase